MRWRRRKEGRGGGEEEEEKEEDVVKEKEDEKGEEEEEVTGQQQENMCHSCRVHASPAGQIIALVSVPLAQHEHYKVKGKKRSSFVGILCVHLFSLNKKKKRKQTRQGGCGF